MKYFLSTLLALALLLPLPARAEDLSVESESCILMEKTTGQILYAENEHQRLEPASVTKIMTLLLTMEAIDSGALKYDDMVTASAYACSMGGSQIWLKEHEQMTVEDMLKAVCVVSANDCSVALAEHIAGSVDAFVDRMNKRAEELGMADTHFENPTGLPAEGHLTSAHDIAIMSRELILHHPDIRRFTTIWRDSLRDGASELTNTNKLIRFYPGATGLKTGSTSSAMFCLSATAEKDGMELIAVIMKSPTSQKRFESAKTLLNYGFAAYGLKTIEPPEELGPIPVKLGDSGYILPTAPEDAALLAEKAKLPGIEVHMELMEELHAPVEKGQQVGTLEAVSEGQVLSTYPILADRAVQRLTYWDIFRQCLHTAFLAG